MTTAVSDIIQDAFRESNLIALVDTPTTAEQTEALRLLNRIVSATFNSDAGEKFTEFPIGRENINRPQGWPYYADQPVNDWYVPLNIRLMLNIDSPQNIYLSPTPEDGSMFAYLDCSNNLAANPITIFGNGRTIEGSVSVTKDTDGDSTIYMYRSDTGNWAKLSPLLLTDVMPFPNDFDDVFIISLARRLNPRNDVTMSPESQAAYRDALTQFKSRYAQIIVKSSELALILTSGMRRIRGAYDGNAAASAFLAGNPITPRGWY